MNLNIGAGCEGIIYPYSPPPLPSPEDYPQIFPSSFPRRRESSACQRFLVVNLLNRVNYLSLKKALACHWIPACAGMTSKKKRGQRLHSTPVSQGSIASGRASALKSLDSRLRGNDEQKKSAS